MDDHSGPGQRRVRPVHLYARKDNVADSSGRGWVTGIKELIEEDSRAVQGREFGVFFDTSEIQGMQDWRAPDPGALRTSKVMLVCLSPNYFDSDPCRWEWDEYRQRQVSASWRASAPGDRRRHDRHSVLCRGAGRRPSVNAKWRDEVMRTDGVDLRPWFPEVRRRWRVSRSVHEYVDWGRHLETHRACPAVRDGCRQSHAVQPVLRGPHRRTASVG